MHVTISLPLDFCMNYDNDDVLYIPDNHSPWWTLLPRNMAPTTPPSTLTGNEHVQLIAGLFKPHKQTLTYYHEPNTLRKIMELALDKEMYHQNRYT